MKVLITGGTGFLGSHIVDQCLDQGNQVEVLVRDKSNLSYLKSLKNVDIITGDLGDEISLRHATKGVEVVYHSAARVCDYGSHQQFYRENVHGTQNLLNASKKNDVGRFVFISSPSVVMNMKDQVNVNESYPYPNRFVNLYSETKAEAEKRVLSSNSPGFITCAIRPRAIWGPRDMNGFLPKILSKIDEGKFRNISGGKKVLASLCYCENAAYACVLASKTNAVGGKAYFIADPERVEIWQFISNIAKFFGLPRVTKTAHPKVVAALAAAVDQVWKIPYLSHRYSPPVSRYSVGLLTLSGTFDTSAAKRDFNYAPKIDHKTGLESLMKWVDQSGGVDQWIHS